MSEDFDDIHLENKLLKAQIAEKDAKIAEMRKAWNYIAVMEIEARAEKAEAKIIELREERIQALNDRAFAWADKRRAEAELAELRIKFHELSQRLGIEIK